MTVLEVLQTVAGVKLGLQRKHPSSNMDELVQIIVGGYQGGYPAANSAAQLMDALVSDGGTVNTGDAAVGDVASGKTFSSASLTNVAGTSTKNATVPDDAPIQPPQAFVDCMAALIAASGNFQAHVTFPWDNKDIASITAAFFTDIDAAVLNKSEFNFHFAGNAIDQASVDRALAYAKAKCDQFSSASIVDVSGGTTSAPTNGAVNDDAWDAAIAGNAVRFNLHGHVVDLYSDGLTFDFSGNAMSASEANAILAKVVAEYPTLALTLKLDGGTNAAPTGQGLTDKQTLIDNGWTVTTN